MKSNVQNTKVTGLNFDDGFKSFPVNGDNTRLIRFNPTDINLMVRATEAAKNIEKIVDELPEGFSVDSDIPEYIEVSKKAEKIIRDNLIYMFNTDCYDAIFAGTHPLSPSSGQFIVNNMLGGLQELLAAEIGIEQEKFKKTLDKYRKDSK